MAIDQVWIKLKTVNNILAAVKVSEDVLEAI